MSQLASVALITARTLLNDDGIQLWTDETLLPKLALAHRELQAMLRANACPITRAMEVSPVPANTTTLQTPPADLIEPITLWEKGTSDPDSAYVRMTEYDPLPFGQALTTRLIWWKWTQEAIEFLGCSIDRVVKVYYRRLISIPTDGNEPIGIIDGELYISPRTAALAFGSTGNTVASEWCTNMAKLTIDDILIANRGRSRMVQKA